MAIDEKELNARLERINTALQNEDVPIAQRPLQAMSRYSAEYKTKFLLTSDLANSISNWFKAKYGEKLLLSFSLYESVYYFDATFWSIEIPSGYGTFKLDPFTCIKGMPDSVKGNLRSSHLGWDYMFWWADCTDYGFGIREVGNGSDPTGFGKELLEAGNEELRAASVLLKERIPNPRAMLNSRNAVEIFLKSMLALKGQLDRTRAKKYGHNLEKIYGAFIEVTELQNWKSIDELLKIYPSVAGRYAKQTFEAKNLWDGFAFAQSLGAIIVRQFTDRDTLSPILKLYEQQKKPT